MDHHPEHDEPRLTDQPAHPRFDRCDLCPKSRQWPCIREVFANETVVQAQGWQDRFYPDIPNLPVVGRVRTDSVSYLCRK